MHQPIRKILMKKCQFCAEEIQDEAIKCRFCGEFLETQESTAGKAGETKWYLKTYWLVIAFLCVGPLALPLLWVNPRFSKTTKIIATIIILVISYFLTVATVKSLSVLNDYYKGIFDQL